jgi:hypothetical protein
MEGDVLIGQYRRRDKAKSKGKPHGMFLIWKKREARASRFLYLTGTGI